MDRPSCLLSFTLVGEHVAGSGSDVSEDLIHAGSREIRPQGHRKSGGVPRIMGVRCGILPRGSLPRARRVLGGSDP